MRKNSFDYKLIVSCLTFNHAPYIVDAMNGFTMQLTDFPFVCCIIDDASTDGEQDVINKYLCNNFELNNKSIVRKEETDDYAMTFARHKTNQNCFFAVYFLKYNHYKKKPKFPYVARWYDNSLYVAMCEGDDYWIDSNKIQKQVLFLDNNPDYSMCFHKAEVIVESGDYSKTDNLMFEDLEEREYSGNELAQKWRVPTASIVYRSYIRRPVDKRLLTGDVCLALQCAMEGRVFCFTKIMSVYRRTSSGATVTRTYTLMQKIDQQLAYIHYFPPFKSYYENLLSKMLGNRFYSRKCMESIDIVCHRKKAVKYLLIGIIREFVPNLRKIYNKLKK